MSRHAILVIDMLNDFANEKGSLYCPGAARITENLQELLKWAREREGGDDVQIVHIQEAHRKK